MSLAAIIAKSPSTGGLLPTGVGPVPYIGATAPTGWVFAAGRTIGNASSGATERANADTEALFTLLWNSFADAQAAVSGGRGANAAADFAANKTIVVPDMRGRVPAGKDDMGGTAAGRLTTAGSGVNGAALGASGGAETHTLSVAQMPSHGHTGSTDVQGAHTHSGGATTGAQPGTIDSTGAPVVSVTGSAGAHSHNVTVANQGGGGAHNNTQPTIVTNYIIKI